MANFSDLRRDYADAGLTEESAGHDPIALFSLWFDQAVAAGLVEPNATTLATATLDGKPSARVVLLKGFDARGFTFFTNYLSRKARELEANPHAALCILWKELERQVRMEGTIERTTADESDYYFSTRPINSRLGAWASEQSSPIADRTTLERQLEEFRALYPGEYIPRPPHWGGYRLIPTSLEFWHGRPSRLHDRLLYTKRADGSWNRNRLAP